MNILEENDWFVFWEEENIVCGLYKTPVIDLEIAKMSVALRLKVSNYIPCKLFIDLKNVKTITKEARDYYGSEVAKNMAEALAVLTPSLVSKIIAAFFINFNKAPMTFKLFNSKEKAFEWLKRVEID